MIEFSDVTKIYQNDIIALDRINLRIDDGEFVFLIGPSGAGKSTLIKLILREEDVTEGGIYLNDTEISALGARRVPNLRRHFGVVFQDFRLLEDRDVFSNVAYALEIHGEPRKKIQNRVVESLTRVGLLEKRKHFPHQLSGGEQQRISIARALINEPEVLIADEPTGNLDSATAEEVMKLLEEINASGTTIIMATHAKDIVNSMRRRVLELNCGRLVRDEEHGAYQGEQNVFYDEESECTCTEECASEETSPEETSELTVGDTKKIPVIVDTHETVPVVEADPSENQEEDTEEGLSESTDMESRVADEASSPDSSEAEIAKENQREVIAEREPETKIEVEEIVEVNVPEKDRASADQAQAPDETEEAIVDFSDDFSKSVPNDEEMLESEESSEAEFEEEPEEEPEEELSPYELGKRYIEKLRMDEALMTGRLPGEEDDHARD